MESGFCYPESKPPELSGRTPLMFGVVAPMGVPRDAFVAAAPAPQAAAAKSATRPAHTRPAAAAKSATRPAHTRPAAPKSTTRPATGPADGRRANLTPGAGSGAWCAPGRHSVAVPGITGSSLSSRDLRADWTG